MSEYDLGKRGEVDRFARDMERKVRDVVSERLGEMERRYQSQLSDVQCPVHGSDTRIKVEMVPKGPDSFVPSITACCEECEKIAAAELVRLNS